MKNLTKEGVKAILGRSIVGTEPYDLAHALLEAMDKLEELKTKVEKVKDNIELRMNNALDEHDTTKARMLADIGITIDKILL